MQIKIDNTQNFGKLKTESNLLQRLNSGKRYVQYQKLVDDMENRLVDCVLSLDEKGRLIAKFENQSFKVPEIKESKIRAYFNLSPIKFIKKMCDIAKVCDIRK